MNRDALIRALRAYSRAYELSFAWDASKGKGGHGEVRVGDRRTIVPTKLSPGRIEAILKQLGLPKNAI